MRPPAPPSDEAFSAAHALLAWVEQQEEPMYFLTRLFKPLWPAFAKRINETNTPMSAYVGNPQNALVFWEYVFDTHRVAFSCVISLLDPVPTWR